MSNYETPVYPAEVARNIQIGEVNTAAISGLAQLIVQLLPSSREQVQQFAARHSQALDAIGRDYNSALLAGLGGDFVQRHNKADAGERSRLVASLPEKPTAALGSEKAVRVIGDLLLQCDIDGQSFRYEAANDLAVAGSVEDFEAALGNEVPATGVYINEGGFVAVKSFTVGAGTPALIYASKNTVITQQGPHENIGCFYALRVGNAWVTDLNFDYFSEETVKALGRAGRATSIRALEAELEELENAAIAGTYSVTLNGDVSRNADLTVKIQNDDRGCQVSLSPAADYNQLPIKTRIAIQKALATQDVKVDSTPASQDDPSQE